MDEVQYDSLAPFDVLDIAKLNNEQMLDVLMKNIGVYDFDVTSRDNGGNSILHIAVYNGNIKLILKAIELGAKINALNNSNQTPLHMAVDRKNPAAVTVLLKHGAAQGIADVEKDTPIVKCIRRGYLNILKSFVQMNADLKCTGHYPASLLHLALHCGHIDMVEVLLSAGEDVNERDNEGHTPIQVAVVKGHSDVVRLMAKNGADIFVKDLRKSNLLHLAVKSESLEVLQTLLNIGLNLNARDVEGSTPLHLALSLQIVDISLFLINHSEDLEVADIDGYTPLHLIAKSAVLTQKLISLILQKIARIDLKTFNGDTALHCAAMSGNLEAAKLLIRNGADVLSTNRDGYTPLDIAVQCVRSNEIPQLLDRREPPEDVVLTKTSEFKFQQRKQAISKLESKISSIITNRAKATHESNPKNVVTAQTRTNLRKSKSFKDLTLTNRTDEVKAKELITRKTVAVPKSRTNSESKSETNTPNKEIDTRVIINTEIPKRPKSGVRNAHLSTSPRVVSFKDEAHLRSESGRMPRSTVRRSESLKVFPSPRSSSLRRY